MKTSEAGIALIKRFERLRTKAYRCPAGVWTIGYGHTKGVVQGQAITAKQADELLTEDLKTAESVVSRECPGLNQQQFDVLVSFVFNCGEGNFMRSTLLKCVRANPQNPNIRHELSRWAKGKGSTTRLPGLVGRRKAEADMYFS